MRMSEKPIVKLTKNHPNNPKPRQIDKDMPMVARNVISPEKKVVYLTSHLLSC